MNNIKYKVCERVLIEVRNQVRYKTLTLVCGFFMDRVWDGVPKPVRQRISR